MDYKYRPLSLSNTQFTFKDALNVLLNVDRWKHNDQLEAQIIHLGNIYEVAGNHTSLLTYWKSNTNQPMSTLTSSEALCTSSDYNTIIINTSNNRRHATIEVLFVDAAQQTELTYFSKENDLERQGAVKLEKVISRDLEHDCDQLCRICFGGGSAEQLIKPCDCRGTVANVHRNCLERWLGQASTSRCELCRHHYTVITTPKFSLLRSVVEWARRMGGRALAADVWHLLVLGSLSVLGTTHVLEACDRMLEAGSQCGGNAFIYANVVSSLAVGIMGTLNGLLTTWTIIRVQAHHNSWQRWRNNTARVRLVLGEAEQQENNANNNP